MATDLHGKVFWPGVECPVGFNYSMSHGVSPETAVLRCLPQDAPIASEGRLSWTDNDGTVVLNDCMLDRVEETRGPNGIELTLLIVDRRWKWRDTGYTKMYANQLDPHGKFVPWTIRSLKELCEWCLEAAGERDYSVDMPVGLTRQDGRGLKEFLKSGTNFPPTGVNPPIDWYYERPMQVLQQLAEAFGRRVVWRWKTDTVHVVRKGSGADLPPGSIFSISPSVNNPEVPDGVAVAGAPTRYQVDIPLQAVGEDWNGLIKPIGDLSYAPQKLGQFHKARASGTYALDYRYTIVINGTVFTGTGLSMAAVTQQLANRINADPDIGALVRAADDATGVTVTARKMGDQFTLTVMVEYVGAVSPVPAEPDWAGEVLKVGRATGGDWSRSRPPMWPGIRATDRLTLSQARELANRTVWKWYQVTGKDPSGEGNLEVPGFGRLLRKQQLILLDTQCEQVVPEDADKTIQDRAGTPFFQNLYDGYSRDKPAVVIGSVYKNVAPHIRYFFNRASGLNTATDEIVQVGFSVESAFLTVRFGSPVYRWSPTGGMMQEPDLKLRTAVHVRELDSNQLSAFFQVRKFPGRDGDRYAVQRHDDVQLNVIPTYDPNWKVEQVELLEQDPLLRARYYLDGMEYQYQVDAAVTQGYNGIVPWELDGACAQISWSLGDPERGAETVISLNYEHDRTVPPYPARRRAENLRSATGPDGFLGKVGERSDPTAPPNYSQKG